MRSRADGCGLHRNVYARQGRVWTTGTGWNASLLGSPFFAPFQRLQVQHGTPPSTCGEQLQHVVMVAVPAKTGCKQLGHSFYNLLMPLQEELTKLGWPRSTTIVYLDCTGGGIGRWGGTTLSRSPEFIHTAFRLVTTQPLRSLPALLSQRHGPASWLRNTLFRERTLCADQLLVGTPCATVDHFNPRVGAESVRLFHSQLASIVLGRSLQSMWTDSATTRFNVLILDRNDSRRILNSAALLHAMRRVPGVGRVRSVMFEKMPLRQQVEMAATSHAMVGIEGTGLFHACYMQPRSTVVVVMPFGTPVLLRNKGTNFVRLWRASRLRVKRIDVLRARDTVQHDPTPRCLACMRALTNASGWLTTASSRPEACKNTNNRGDVAWYGCVLNQASRVPLTGAVRAIEDALKPAPVHDG
jgi:hypothetical protein